MNIGRFTTAELSKLGIPGCPTTSQGWDKRVKNEGWECHVVRGRGRGGERHEYVPPPEMAALIVEHLLRTAFDEFRIQVASGEPLETAKGMFVSDYNDAAGVVNRVPGLATLTSDQLDAALSGRPLVREYAVGHVSTRHMANERPAPDFSSYGGTESDQQLGGALAQILTVAEAQLGKPLSFAVARSLIGVATHWRGVAERTGQLARLEAIKSAAEMYFAIEQQSRTD